MTSERPPGRAMGVTLLVWLLFYLGARQCLAFFRQIYEHKSGPTKPVTVFYKLTYLYIN